MLTQSAAPLYICDRERLGSRTAVTNEFDNRYFLDDSILPSKDVLAREGIMQIVCVVPDESAKPSDDLRAYFRDLKKEGFSAIYGASATLPELKRFSFPEDTFDIQFSRWGYQRSDAGGFGRLIPEPSSSGG